LLLGARAIKDAVVVAPFDKSRSIDGVSTATTADPATGISRTASTLANDDGATLQESVAGADPIAETASVVGIVPQPATYAQIKSKDVLTFRGVLIVRFIIF
jgi:hypothetical protein